MTSLGSAEYPEMTVSEALECIEGIKREKAQTTAALGQLMGLKNVTSGYFYAKVSALSKFYGLVERQKTSITLTSLAKRIIYSVSAEDREKAIREVATRVSLLSSLYHELGPEFHALDFPEKLMKLTGAEHKEIVEKSSQVEALYRDALHYLEPPVKRGGDGNRNLQAGEISEKSGSRERVGEDIFHQAAPFLHIPPKLSGPVRTLQSEDGYFIRVVLDKDVIQEAIDILAALQKRLSAEQRPAGAPAEDDRPLSSGS